MAILKEYNINQYCTSLGVYRSTKSRYPADNNEMNQENSPCRQNCKNNESLLYMVILKQDHKPILYLLGSIQK